MKGKFHFKIGGLAGEGIMTTGSIFTKLASRSGFYTFDFVEYPSLVRGGHNTFYGAISKSEVYSTYHQIDLLIALNQETVNLHKKELNSGGGIIYNADSFTQDPIEGIKLFPVPLVKLAEEAGHKVMANTVALGALCFLTGSDLLILNAVLEDVFSKKKKEIVEDNIKAAKLGFDFVKNKFSPLTDFLKPQQTQTKKMLIAGNEAIALGAIAAGMKFTAIYPMTPISSILTFLAAYEKEAGIILRQPEDEIAGISMALGASFAGVRSMVATSGGGFALMSETLSLAGISETPVVVIFGQRAGPATGIPTWTAQEDLLYALTAAQGEYPRILLAPGDAEECFYQVAEAFNLAEVYQTPVVVMVDKFVCEAHKTVSEFDLGKVKINRGKISDYKPSGTGHEIFPRYKLTPDGISPRVFPGKGIIVKSNSDEHNEFGLSEESSENRNARMKKRMGKLKPLVQALPVPKLYGPEKADLTIVSWGSTKGPILEAISGNKKTNFLHLNYLNPFPIEAVTGVLKNAKKTLLIENNYQGQLGSWIRMQTGIEIKDKFLKYDGRQFYPEEIIKKI